MFADVIVDITNEEVDKTFEYSFTDENIKAGSRVIVPFGRKVLEGIVMRVKETSIYEIDKIKPADPTNPHSSPTVQKIKSVSCSGTNFSFVCVPCRKPFPVACPEPIAIND